MAVKLVREFLFVLLSCAVGLALLWASPFTTLWGLVGGEGFLFGIAGFFTSRVLSCVG